MAKDGKRKVPENLPGSGKKEFWGDAEKHSGYIEKFKPRNCKWKQKGHMAYCTSCKYDHGVFLGPDKEIRDGKIVTRRIVGRKAG